MQKHHPRHPKSPPFKYRSEDSFASPLRYDVGKMRHGRIEEKQEFKALQTHAAELVWY
jgi:hypothetical protein